MKLRRRFASFAFADAEPAYRAALAVGQQLVNDFPSIPDYRSDVAKTHTRLASCLSMQGKQVEAEAEVPMAMAEAFRKDGTRITENLDFGA